MRGSRSLRLVNLGTNSRASPSSAKTSANSALSSLAPYMKQPLSRKTPVFEIDVSAKLITSQFSGLHICWSPFIFQSRLYFNSMWF